MRWAQSTSRLGRIGFSAWQSSKAANRNDNSVTGNWWMNIDNDWRHTSIQGYWMMWRNMEENTQLRETNVSNWQKVFSYFPPAWYPWRVRSTTNKFHYRRISAEMMKWIDECNRISRPFYHHFITPHWRPRQTLPSFAHTKHLILIMTMVIDVEKPPQCKLTRMTHELFEHNVLHSTM